MKKENAAKKNVSSNSLYKCFSKKSVNFVNEGQYIIIFDSLNNSFNFLGKNTNKKRRFSFPNFKNIINKEFTNDSRDKYGHKKDNSNNNLFKYNSNINKKVKFWDNKSIDKE